MDILQVFGLGLVYPDDAAEDDYPPMEKTSGRRVRVEVVHTPWQRTPTKKAR